MKRSGELGGDMMTLARLHAALDSVIETQQMMAQIRESSRTSQPTVARVQELIAETRELLRWLLAPPEARNAVKKPFAHLDPGVT
jgi:hypothetical protein